MEFEDPGEEPDDDYHIVEQEPQNEVIAGGQISENFKAKDEVQEGEDPDETGTDNDKMDRE